jgi:hypothetical protein
MKPSKYLLFKQYSETEKTKSFHVISKKHGDLLGVVRWYPRWRQYTFFPEPDTVWNTECLWNICAFIGVVMEDPKIQEALAAGAEGSRQ